MKILVVSDTHKNYKILYNVVRNNLDSKLIIHLGDGEIEAEDISREFPDIPLVYVGGNCDFKFHKEFEVVRAEGYSIFCCHGDRHRVKLGLELLISEAHRRGCQIALYGHTHVAFKDVIGGMCVMNPGSLDFPRGGVKPSYGVFEIERGKQIKMEIVETEKIYD